MKTHPSVERKHEGVILLLQIIDLAPRTQPLSKFIVGTCQPVKVETLKRFDGD